MQPIAVECSTVDTKTNPSNEVVFVPYARAFLLDGQPLSATERVRPWKGHVAECVGTALLLPKDMRNWEEWYDEDLLNMKGEAMIVHFTIYIYIYMCIYIISFLFHILLFKTLTFCPPTFVL